MAGKNEVALDFNPPPALPTVAGTKPEKPADELVEMRFYIPQRLTGKKSRTGSAASDDEDEEEDVDPEDVVYDSDGNEISPAEIFHKTIMDQAELGEQAGDAIASFTDVSVVTPRSAAHKIVSLPQSWPVPLISFISAEIEVDMKLRCTTNIYDCMERLTIIRSCTNISTDNSSCLERIRCTNNLL
jgi:hypothetical protein